ncbi:DUF3027 domain-containing protein [Kocuria palustris]|uniref:DUF3027 domain-containing protein n=1 Tax=Kocuria palustris TaxID=71999 RepID=UPI001643295D|nr:DUF3027 domain-containing protein [Kocuria palustris]
MTHETSTQERAPEQAPAARGPEQAPDPQLAEARDFALAALRTVEPADVIGEGHRVLAEGELAATHLFPSSARGYRGWEWYVTIARTPDSSEPTVCETGLIPGDDALLAPAWVPWSERVVDADHDTEHDHDAEHDGRADGPDGDAGAGDDVSDEADIDPAAVADAADDRAAEAADAAEDPETAADGPGIAEEGPEGVGAAR